MSRQRSRDSGCFFGRFLRSQRGSSSSRRSHPPPPSLPGVTGAGDDSDAQAARGGVEAEARSRRLRGGKQLLASELQHRRFVRVLFTVISLD